MPYRRIASFRIPLVGQAARSFSSSPVQISETIKKTNHLAVVKPQRQLGAPWIDRFINQRKVVTICDICSARYGNWYQKYNYTSDWVGWLINCDGCSRLVYCNGYHPTENIARTLHPRFWHEDYKDQRRR